MADQVLLHSVRHLRLLHQYRPSVGEDPALIAPQVGGGAGRAGARAADLPRRTRVGEPPPPAPQLAPRPGRGDASPRAGMALSRSAGRAGWGPAGTVMGPRSGAWWGLRRSGIGPPLLKTEHGWLMIYHGVKETVAGALYRVGAALLDLDDPTRVIGRSPEWILSPNEPYERAGDVPNAVFPCGLTHDQASGELQLYYGAADTSICVATALLEDVLAVIPDGGGD